MKNPNDANGNRTRYVPVYSAVHYGNICSYSLQSNIYIPTIVFERKRIWVHVLENGKTPYSPWQTTLYWHLQNIN